MEFKDLTNKKPGDLQKLLAEKRNELRELRFKVSGGQLKKVRDIRTVRQAIARILTALNASKQ